ncbi:hypothetical protein GRH90_25410 [Enterobacteriales bacterium SAP-6]|uniref:Uncharacterized protein n=1 Tax=Acerihabitans arboris TaxID=2691583 RepID=A0A845SLA2_9GAMM|nr:hypothetical protein [Acerihabitans arboris]
MYIRRRSHVPATGADRHRAASFITGIDLAADGGFSELGTYGAVWKHLHATS